MIRLNCTQCKATLEMDEAFAGGVCRCQHCGTIQTVPSHLKAAAGAAPKSLYQTTPVGAGRTGTRGNGTGLDELADVVASSGLSRSSLRGAMPESRVPSGGNALDYRSPAKSPKAGPKLGLLAAAGAVILILIGLVIWLAVRSSPPAPAPLTNGTTPGGAVNPANPDTPELVKPNVAAAPAGPHFLTVPVSGSKVVYVIDRSDSARQVFDGLKAGVFGSLESLGADHDFAVIFWGHRGEKDLKEWSFPESGTARATPQKIEDCRNKFQDTQAVGATDVAAAIQQAVSRNPDVIFLVTAKGVSLGDDVTSIVDKARGKSPVKINTIDLSNGEAKKILEPIANHSGGTYKAMSMFDLK